MSANDTARRTATGAAIRLVESESIIGVETGSTVAHSLDALASAATAEREGLEPSRRG